MEIAAGAQVVVRDEEWLVRSVRSTEFDGARIEVTGVTELVRDREAVFFEALEKVGGGAGIVPLDPRQTTLVADDTPGFRRSRLWLESTLRQAPASSADTRILVGNRGLLDPMGYQLKPAQLALENLRPRILIGDAVGLGKTLEIGVLLSELIRRGRGERILVVTPRAVLEQFQHELWTRFAIPLVRLDSDGIQRVRRELPADRNPFSHYRRAIISIDTLKNPARYRHHLQKQQWDVVVIDECHNLINRNTQNNQLAKLLAAQADALILASATPHNGKQESFAELISLLDPAAIADPKEYGAEEISHLYVRRHRNSSDVKSQVGHRWAQRRDPEIIAIEPTPAEQEVLDELNTTWLHPADGQSVLAHRNQRLVPWGFLKSFLSSSGALTQTIERRLKVTAHPPEQEALRRLRSLSQTAQLRSSKFEALVGYLAKIGVKAGGETRIVIFSERIPTLIWLQQELTKRLKLRVTSGKSEIAVLHATLPDKDVQQIVNDFALEQAPIRILLASDMASEGINLHRQCHHLLHFDLPWSFIRIQQRNGRIDRYLQTHEPRIAALALTSPDPEIDSDLKVVTKLLRKEYAANQALGDAGVLLDLHDADVEEEEVMKAMQQGIDLDDLVTEPSGAAPAAKTAHPFSWMLAAGAQHSQEPPPPTGDPITVFEDEDNYLTEALNELYPDPKKLHMDRDADNDFLAFDTPADLLPRLRDLPDTYLDRIRERIRLSANATFAEERLAKARAADKSLWPDVHFLPPLHPVLDWVASRSQARLGRNEAPVMVGRVPGPVFLTQAVWSTAGGRPAITVWSAISGLPSDPIVGDLKEMLETVGINEKSVNPGTTGIDLLGLQNLVGKAIDVATTDIEERRADLDANLRARLAEHQKRLSKWQQQALFTVQKTGTHLDKRRTEISDIHREVESLINDQQTSGRPFVRVIGVISPAQ